MLESLLIENFAIIDRMQLEFNNDMSVLTGETGAGKSIIIDAIGQLLGNRTQTSFIKTGQNRAFIEGVFDIYDNKEVQTALEEAGFDNDDKLVVSKSFQMDGKTVIKINYRTISQALLKSIMPLLVDIHSQFETHTLFDEKNHITILDSYIGDKIIVLLKQYQDAYRKYKDTRSLYQQVINDELSDEQLEFYQARLHEINELDLDSIDEHALEKEKKELLNYEKTFEKISLYQQYMGSSQGVISNLDSALSALGYLQDKEEYQEYYNQLYDTYYIMKDIDEGIMDTFHNTTFDEYRLQEVQDTLFKLNRLKRKYGLSLEAIKEAKKELEEKIEAFVNREEYITNLQKAYENARKVAKDKAEKISQLRKQKAKEFTKSITHELQDLYLPKVQFEVQFTDTNLFNYGKDKVVFMISTNIGQELKPLHKVSSGGELSRIMLAIKVLSLQYSSIKTIIFDEADSGVSGKVADSIGRKMKEIAKNKQVLCITHLAQVASFAKYHYLIEKQTTKNTTSTSILLLDEPQSIEELAKMISGKEVSQESLQHASHLKQQNSA